jgi:opacity protein-like surface antigen
MKAIAVAAALATLAAVPAVQAQTTSGSGITWPHQRGFWGHVGASVGRSELDASCPGGGFTCDDSDQAYRVFAGGRFNNAIGAELAWVNLGEWARGGGDTDSQALDLALVAGIPFGQNNRHSVFLKAGVNYARSEVQGTAAGLQTGKEDGWGPRFGFGASFGLTDNWAIRADWDRYRIKIPGAKEDVDTLTIGAQYQFR